MNSNARLIQMLAESPIIVRRRLAGQLLESAIEVCNRFETDVEGDFTYALVAKPGE
ncbi:MAG: hypothetical protein WBL39_01345 [Terrimicrobiaceae bacterium]